ncbi:MAG: Coenzyme F420 hydrogenase/dehydrogenase, beta subunit C-terminal domain, partial [Desulfobacteraceae bacterium]|nr:Coenzyme F420 hydrogenase/dehydrogenase, beta subunit C-terminal domain [Desulfobacteraceae bacterium]
ADLSFGGIGAEEGWTTVIARTPVGRALVADARSKAIEINRQEKKTGVASRALKSVRSWSAKKRDTAATNRKSLGKKYPDLQK